MGADQDSTLAVARNYRSCPGARLHGLVEDEHLGGHVRDEVVAADERDHLRPLSRSIASWKSSFIVC
jgi:hypothetical protein